MDHFLTLLLPKDLECSRYLERIWRVGYAKELKEAGLLQ